MLVCNNGLEVQFFDLYKIEGVLELNVSCDFFEGLLISDVEGYFLLGVVEKWENKDFKVWIFYLCENVKWLDGMFVIVYDFVYSW